MPLPSARDYDRMLELAATLFESPEPDDAWRLVGQEFLGPLFHADVFVFVEIDFARSTGQILDIKPDWAARQIPAGSDLHEALITDHPLSLHYAKTGTDAPLKISDLVYPLAWRQMAGYATMRELLGATHHLNLPLPAKGFRGLTALRAEGDFSERDTTLAKRLQPLLFSVDRHLQQLDRWRATTAASDQCHNSAAAITDLKITPRELVILAALADGLTASAIARRLNISARTVTKHQENLYRKLGTTDRLTTVLRAQYFGLLPSPQPLAPAGRKSSPRPRVVQNHLPEPVATRDETPIHDPIADLVCDETPLPSLPVTRACAICGQSVAPAATGRPRSYCSRACQQQAYRNRQK